MIPPAVRADGLPKKKRQPYAWTALLLLCIVPILGQWNALWQGDIPWFMDTVTQFYPFRLHAAHLLGSGNFPFWNRTIFGGVPLLANPQWGLLYPGHWPFLLAPGPRIYTLTNVGHIALLGLGMFFWVRETTRAGWLGALLAGLLVELGGWTWAHLAFGSYLQVGAWAPWMFFAYERFRKTNRPFWPAVAGAAGAMQWLAGAPQLAVYCMGGLWIYAILGWVLGKVRSESSEKLSFRSLCGFLGLHLLIALSLSAPQWMTTQAFMVECERAGKLPLAQVMAGASDLAGLVRAWFGGTGRPEDAEQILYPGILATALALLAVACSLTMLLKSAQKKSSPSQSSLPVSSVIAACFLLIIAMLLTWKPLVPFLYRFAPLYGNFHDPRRILFLAFLATIFLAGVGLEILLPVACRKFSASALSGKRSAVVPHSAPPSASVSSTAFLCLGILALVVLTVADPLIFALRRIDTKTIPVAKLVVLSPAKTFGMQAGQRFFAHDIGIQYSYNYTRADFGQTLLPNLGALYGYEDVQGYDPLIPWRYAVFMRRLNRAPVPAVTLYPNHFGLVRNPDSPWLPRFGKLNAWGPLDYQWPFFPPHWLKPGAGFEIPLSKPWQPHSLSQIRAYIASVKHSGPGKDSLILRFHSADKELASLTVVSAPPAPSPGSSRAPAQLWDNVWPPSSNITSVRLAANEPASPQPPDSDTAARVERITVQNLGSVPVLLYSLGLPDPPPQFRPSPTANRFVPLWRDSFPDEAELHPVSDVNPNSRSVYENWAASLTPGRVHIEIPNGQQAPSNASRVIKGWRWTEKRTNRLRIELPSNHGEGWLVLSEPFMPGWKCRVDGRPLQIYAADTWFRAVPVAANARIVEMRYFPPGLWRGLLVAILGILVTGARFRRRKNQSQDQRPDIRR